MPLGREQKLWKQVGSCLLGGGGGSSGRFKKWKNNEESYINKTQQQMNCKQQQCDEHELPTMTRKLL